MPLPYTLLPGQGADVAFVYTIPIGTTTMDFAVIANPPTGSSPAFECRDDNNEAALFGIECPPPIGG